MPNPLKHVCQEYIRTKQKINQVERTIKHSEENHQAFLRKCVEQSKPAKEINRIRKIIRSK